MRLTERDMQIIKFCEEGATLGQIAAYFFPSYSMASQRMVKLVRGRFLKEGINPTIGKKVFFKTKMPSYHRLVINDIKLYLRGKYIFFETEYTFPNTKCRVDCIIVLKSKKTLIFEINIFKRTTQKRVDFLNRLFAENSQPCDVWIVEWHRTRQVLRGAKVIDMEELKGLTTTYK